MKSIASAVLLCASQEVFTPIPQWLSPSTLVMFGNLQGDKNAADQAAVDMMRKVLNTGISSGQV